MTAFYCTLDYCKQFMESQIATGSTLGVADKQILDSIRVVSKRVDRAFQNNRPQFAPYYEKRKTLLTASKVNSFDNTLLFDGGSLLELDAVDVNGTSLTVNSNVNAYPDPSVPPFREVFLNDASLSWYGFCLSNFRQQQYVNITGYWGFHTDYLNAFQTNDALTAAITTTTQSTFTVTSVVGADIYGMTPRISAGDLVKIDTELMFATYTDGATTVHVLRGYNGTTAATHLINAPVYTYQVEEPVKAAVAKQAGMRVARIGGYNSVVVQGMSEIRYPADWLTEVWQMIGGYIYS